MAITGPIPLPESGADAFMKGATTSQSIIDSLIKNKLNPYQIQLLQGQAQEAQAKGNAATSQQDLLKSIIEGKFNLNGMPQSSASLNQNVPQPSNNNKPSSPYQKLVMEGKISPQDQMEGHEINPNQLNNPAETKEQPVAAQMPSQQQNGYKQYAQHVALAKLAGLPPIPIEDIDGTKMAITPFGAPIPLASGPTAMQKAINAEDAKLIGSWGEQISSGHDIQSTLDRTKDIVTSPVMQSMKNNPVYFGRDIEYYKRFGTPEQQKMIGNLAATNKSMYTSMAQKFKGAFRAGEQSLFEQMLVDEKDTLPVMLGKMEAMDTLNQLMVKRLTLSDDLARNHGKIPSKALEMADKALDSKSIEKKIQNQINGPSKEEQNLLPVEGKTWVKSPAGKIVAVPNGPMVLQAITNGGIVLKPRGQNG